ncbi:MAG TPA: hypothetical protein VIT20_04505 [Propionibacteriaceae bacterium]
MPSYDDDAMMARFVADYLALLDQRVITIQAQLRVGRLTTAQVAMLSLESTSTMVGATAMATIVGQLRAALERGDLPALPELSRAMVAEADNVRLQLRTPDRS